MFLILILRLILKFLSPVSIIGIVSFHKLIKLCNQAVNNKSQGRKHKAFLLDDFSPQILQFFPKNQEIMPICWLWCKYFLHKLTLHYLYGQIVNQSLLQILSKLCNGSSFYQLQIVWSVLIWPNGIFS